MTPSEIEEIISRATREQWEELDLSGRDLTDLPSSIGKLKNLKRLILGKWDSAQRKYIGNNLTTLPLEISELTNLKSLGFAGNKIKSFPNAFERLTRLQFLDMSNNQISLIQNSILRLSSLQFLHLRNNQITEIPNDIWRLTRLQSLDLSDNLISQINSAIARLTNLETLDLSNNQIQDIPDAISRRIMSISLRDNQIKEIPQSIGCLANLQSLDLSGNNISKILEEINQLTKLEYLNLSANNISKIPESINYLTKLEYLNLSGNNISKIPEGIGRLTKLEYFYLSANNIYEIAVAITRLINLQSLDLSGNNITKIPENIVRLTALQALKLSENKLSDIPEGIMRLTNLKVLDLSGNNLTKIPKSIIQLTNLISLDLSRNSLYEITEVITRLISLKCLAISKIDLSEIPEAITQLTNLQTLDLSRNNISEIPEAITQLTNLQTLDLSKNNISEIPESITQLTNLQFLGLERNDITKISDAIVKIPNLSDLDLRNNPLSSPPLEVAEKGIVAIREYFQQLEVEGKDYLYEAKLLIVGEGGAGKTTLANKMIDPNYKLREEEETTKGIDVIRCSFSFEDGKKSFSVNIWDFGGQEIYHATHQYFLTKRSVYALVADTRNEDTPFYYWLNVVELLSDKSPILIVNNEKQDRKREININQLKVEFDNLEGIIAVNLKTGRGFRKLIRAFQYYLTELPHIGTVLPKTWIKVRQTLENSPINYISLDTYINLCAKNGFKQRKDALQLSGYLHDLGICLHFQDDPLLSKTVILNPKWGTDAAYAVLDNKRVIDNHGCFSHQDLTNIWSDKEYAGMHDELLQLMMKFQLCYEIPRNKGSYIAPQLLTENQPTYDWNESENLILRYNYDFMPKGIVRQFIVAMHQDIEFKENVWHVWRSGVTIRSQAINNTRAEVIENYDKREIKIRISGKNKKELLAIVLHELDKIHDLYPRLKEKYQKLIPCNCSTCKGSQSPHFYKFSDLKRRYEKRVPTVQCEISYENVDVLGLIDDVGERSQLQDSRRNLDLEYSIDNDPTNKPNFVNKIYIKNQQQQQGSTMDNQQQRQINSDNAQQQQQFSQPKYIKSAWANGSFYLFLFVVVVGGIGYLAGTLKLLNLIAVIVAGIVFIPLVGALQLRQDDRLSEKNFMELIKLVIAQLPLIGNIFKPFMKNNDDK
ncbi:COR domain-containing protein [Pseudanabaena sp. BC1403]|uniref:leucine-rich repeat domain-containing protein n=1 Tax=Pseudanabaena sp. BC1403 TaxID=2043171 RepID=UPI000CD84CC9|nr:COR domain-containing protein [Pseudanabaena sp. BC1403]